VAVTATAAVAAAAAATTAAAAVKGQHCQGYRKGEKENIMFGTNNRQQPQLRSFLRHKKGCWAAGELSVCVCVCVCSSTLFAFYSSSSCITTGRTTNYNDDDDDDDVTRNVTFRQAAKTIHHCVNRNYFISPTTTASRTGLSS